MSDVKRTIAEIQQEYSNTCVKAGNLQYQIVTLSKDLDLLNGVLRDLNNEAFAVQQAEKAASESKAS